MEARRGRNPRLNPRNLRGGCKAARFEAVSYSPWRADRCAYRRRGRVSSDGKTGAVHLYQTAPMLLIDAANVIGSRPTGWWRDRAGAARAFVDLVRAAVDAGRVAKPVIVVLEGKAREGVQGGVVDGVTVLHAAGSGDDTLIQVAGNAHDQVVTLVTADRELRQRAEALGADVVGPGWLLELLDQ
jgi:hypothetical protein